MTNKEKWAWIGIAAAGGAILYYLNSQGIVSLAAATGSAVPLSAYPEYAYTAAPATTTMMATAWQKAPAAVVPPSPLYASVQQQEQSAIYEQCVGAAVCSPLTGDTQLGF